MVKVLILVVQYYGTYSLRVSDNVTCWQSTQIGICGRIPCLTGRAWTLPPTAVIHSRALQAYDHLVSRSSYHFRVSTNNSTKVAILLTLIMTENLFPICISNLNYHGIIVYCIDHSMLTVLSPQTKVDSAMKKRHALRLCSVESALNSELDYALENRQVMESRTNLFHRSIWVSRW